MSEELGIESQTIFVCKLSLPKGKKSIFRTRGSFTTWSNMPKGPKKLDSYLSQKRRSGIRGGGTISLDDYISKDSLQDPRKWGLKSGKRSFKRICSLSMINYIFNVQARGLKYVHIQCGHHFSHFVGKTHETLNQTCPKLYRVLEPVCSTPSEFPRVWKDLFFLSCRLKFCNEQ